MTGLALAAVYLVWGSTYLAIRYALEGFPPLLMGGIRFLAAGAAMYVFLRLRGVAAPSRHHWWSAAQLGALLVVGGTGLVTVAEDLGIGSGVAATAVAAMPLWAALASGAFGRAAVRLEWVGLLIGFAGVVILGREGDLRSSIPGATLVVLAPMLWGFGSVWSQRLRLPGGSMATATQLLTGGAMLTIGGVAAGESIDSVPRIGAWLALLYLTVMGSVIAYSAYMFLLRKVRPALATSYAYVNPVVAVILGVALGGEHITGYALLALPVILLGVALVGVAQRRPSPGRPGGEIHGTPGSADPVASPVRHAETPARAASL